ncbi:hypothetical protein [Marinomonas shanghaiensis]|uniref:hypothetical protein n=1 Tax=Marinomonas shanghaiensis TaxID=2202418 RepID=UPI003A911876
MSLFFSGFLDTHTEPQVSSKAWEIQTVLLIVLLKEKRGELMSVVTANDLKTKGVSAIEASLLEDEEVIISVRGRNTYVVMDLHKYAKFREYELEIALLEARADLRLDVIMKSSVNDHMLQVSDEL